MRVRLKSQMFFSKTSLIENLMKKQKCFEVVIYNRINLFFLHLCLKWKLEEQRSHKVVTVKSIEFDLLLLVSLLCHQMFLNHTVLYPPPTEATSCMECEAYSHLVYIAWSAHEKLLDRGFCMESYWEDKHKPCPPPFS